jgi:membrane-bound lytic murein transglycosylase D
MMSRFFILTVTLITLSACAHKSTTSTGSSVSASTDAPAGREKNSHLITQGYVPDCPGCIKGSSTDEYLKNNDKRHYFLYGAEHLNLKNMYFDIPVVYNDAVKKWMNYFTGKGRPYFIKYSQRAGMYAPILSKILSEEGMPRDLIYLAMAESGFHNKAKSWAKAVGPWQFMPYTGKKFGLNIDFYVDERRDPFKATKAASAYLKQLYGMFGNWELAMASYNAGEGKMKRAIQKYGTDNFWEIRNGRYLKPETKNYVPKIMALAILGKNLETFGFNDIDFNEHLDFDEVEVKGDQDLYQIAQSLGVEFDELHYLNPELKRWQTPPYVTSYKLRIPPGMKPEWDNCCVAKDFTTKDYKHYVVNKGGNLRSIASVHKVPAEVLSQINGGIKPDQPLGQRSTVFLPFHTTHNNKEDMYADLYDRPRKATLRRNHFKSQLARAMAKGQLIRNPRTFYTVQRGDSLWSISRKFNIPLDTLMRSNYTTVRKGSVLPGDKLAIR